MQLAHTQFPILNEMATATRVLVIAAVLGVGYRYRKVILLAGFASYAVLGVPGKHDDMPGHTEGTSDALPDVKPKTTVGKQKAADVQPPENRDQQPSQSSEKVVPPDMTPEQEAALRDLGKSTKEQFKWLSPSSSSG